MARSASPAIASTLPKPLRGEVPLVLDGQRLVPREYLEAVVPEANRRLESHVFLTLEGVRVCTAVLLLKEPEALFGVHLW